MGPRALETITANALDQLDARPTWGDEIATAMKDAGIPISVTVVDQLLKKHHFRRRKAVKTRATGTNEQRNAQFENIAAIKTAAIADGNPVLSMDVKKN